MLLGHQLQQFALAHHGISEIKPCEFDLLRMMNLQSFAEPVIQGPMILKLECANRVSDLFNRIALAVGKIIGRIDTPFIARAVMMGMLDAVHHRVTQIDIRRSHVDLRAQGPCSVGELAFAHPREQIEILLDIAVTVRAVLAGSDKRASVFADLVGGQVTDVRLARLDELYGPVMELIEIIGRKVQTIFPVAPQPTDVVENRIDVFLFFLGGIRVVEPQVELATILPREARIQTNAFGMADV